MRILLLIGPEERVLVPLEAVLGQSRDVLRESGVWYPEPEDQGKILMALVKGTAPRILNREKAPDLLVLSAARLGSALHTPDQLRHLREGLEQLGSELRIVSHLDNQSRALAGLYEAQVMAGRVAPLTREIGLCAQPDWWQACLTGSGDSARERAEALPFWLDYRALFAFWETGFGKGAVEIRPRPSDAAQEIEDLIGISLDPAVGQPAAASAASLARARQLNGLLWQVVARRGKPIPADVWRGMLEEIAVDGPLIDPGSLFPVAERFAVDNASLVAEHPQLTEALSPPEAAPEWQEADPGYGFRASQYLLAFMWRIDRAMRAPRRAEPAPAQPVAPNPILPPIAREKFASLAKSPFRPHNRIGSVDEEITALPYDMPPPRDLPAGSTGRVIVGCMKNEAPYILEWIAYHRAIGVDNFLIYTNGCEDGTDKILGRLQEMEVVQHRRNDDWKGKSPQQYALNRSLKEPLIEKAEWIIHIDVDEFINLRCGNGTLDDFFALVPGATNVAMTWRLFGHNGVTVFDDRFVIEQFDRASPKYCPKPHTVWGFKTMFRNIGAYGKISCHRPNKLDETFRDRVRWVNGSGQDMTDEARDRGWRNSRASVGYDLIQLNHYALRSADSFLIKRQRGRALHVDRSIGLNYWIRMDWCDHRDVTIQRNLPRLRAEYDRLLADDRLRQAHEDGVAWHRAKALALRQEPEFRELFEQAVKIRLTETERAAYALALDMES
ncbi:glycosyltransferase family 2 protein [Heliomarina baculiformis]|uniref:glycosyltransferase family 2 protein n=1 Tax=Heliomarina baculiformis TaxID=2872036 RepID=UPI001EE280C0|nr:glycosyltransferase family 2 protein [Heliomarina baculiformis]